MYSHILADLDVVINILQFYEVKTYILSLNCLFRGEF